MPPQALAALATLIGFAPHGNRIALQLDRGSAEIVWVTASTFRYRRTLDGPLPGWQAETPAALDFTIDDAAGVLRTRSKFIEVTIEKHGLAVRVRRLDGTPLLRDLTEPRPGDGTFTWERQALAGVRFYGLGPRSDGGFNLSGTRQTTDTPFLFCTAGYGEYHPAAGIYRFDFTSAERYRIQAPAIDYYFYYGPTLKQVLEEHHRVIGPAALWAAAHDRFGSWESLRAVTPRVLHGAMSGMIAPTFDLKPYDGAPDELRARARQLGSLVTEVSPGRGGLSEFRRQLESFFNAYAMEAHLKGYPPWHPLPFQFPDDPESVRHTDEFLLGDEMLVAPIVTPGNSRRVYLPQGIWTSLETNEVVKGPQTISVTTTSLPVFARNGAIVPLDSDGGMELHYFPKLGAEFFLIENDGDWTQIHAAPAGDVMRLEIESKAARDYEWVVHHVDGPAEVRMEGARPDRTWSWDEKRRDLRIRVRVGRGEDSVINVAFP